MFWSLKDDWKFLIQLFETAFWEGNRGEDRFRTSYISPIHFSSIYFSSFLSFDHFYFLEK